jgi:MFS superfamily sulfate permease-like transporter
MKVKVFSTKFLKEDFLSGVIVFLIALPLCLGIAQASNAPLFAGIVAGIVGGLVIGSLSKSHLSVSGPAAGLTAIVIAAISELQVFEIFLCSVIIAGVAQIALGYIKAGAIANYIPTSVLEGMLAGIGLTIAIKQLPDAVGYAKDNAAVMVDADDGIFFNQISIAAKHIEPGAAIISLAGIAILAAWQTKAFKRLQLIPPGLLVVVMGTLLNQFFMNMVPQLWLDASHLVKLPIATSAKDFFNQFTFPEPEGFMLPEVWEIGIIIAVVASIESLLCIEAVDKLDPHKRNTPANSELKAQGIGNIVSGLIGGMPVTSVIVRSSANVNAGAQTKRSAIIHGALLLICVAAIPAVLNLIPKASLAAILIFTGYRLCRPAIFRHMRKGGWARFVPFLATVAGVVFLDLLKGVGLGLLLSIIYMMRESIRIPYYYERRIFRKRDVIKLTLAQEVSFLNKASIKDTLNYLPDNACVIVDAGKTEYIDADVLEIISDFYMNGAAEKKCSIVARRV